MKMLRTSANLLLALASFALLATAAPTLLKFAPSPETDYTVRSFSTRTTTLGDRHIGADTTYRTWDCELRAEGKGWIITSVCTDFQGVRDSLPLDSQVTRLLVGLKTKMTLDSIGQAITVEGYPELRSKVSALEDTSAVRQINEMISPELMASKDLDEWNLRLASLVGRQFSVGSVTHQMSEIALPDDAKLMQFELDILLDTLRFQGRLFARLMHYADTDPIRLAKTTNRSVGRMAEIFKIPDTLLAHFSEPVSDYRTTHEMIFDVETLMLASEKIEREVVLRQIQELDRTIFSHLIETTEKSYTNTTR